MLNLVSDGPLGKREMHISLEKALCTGISDFNGVSRISGKQRQASVKKDQYAFGDFFLRLRNRC